MRDGDSVVETIYLVLEPARRGSRVIGFRAQARKTKPPEGSSVVVALKLRIPASVFEPILVEADVTVNENEVAVIVEVQPVDVPVGSRE